MAEYPHCNANMTAVAVLKSKLMDAEGSLSYLSDEVTNRQKRAQDAISALATTQALIDDLRKTIAKLEQE